MICASIVPSSVAEGRRLLEELNGFGGVEVRLDLLGNEDFSGLFVAGVGLRIATCRPVREGGSYEGDESARLAILRKGLEAGADLVDVEAAAAEKSGIPPDRRIVSLHRFDETPDDLAGLARPLLAIPARAHKLVTTATEPMDGLRLLRTLRDDLAPPGDWIAFAMGEPGIPSRVLACAYGSWMTYGAGDPEAPTAPGQLPAATLRDLYRVDRIGPGTPRYAVIGRPIAHSLSPQLHNRAFAVHRYDGVYLPVTGPDLDGILRFLQEGEFAGFNVTIPFKEEILRSIDMLTPSAKRLRAANAVRRDGARWIGTNTDVTAIASLLPGDTQGKAALVLGAGGAARAAVAALRDAGAEVRVAGRTPDRAERLAADFRCGTVPWEERASIPFDLLINATPIGTASDESPMPATPFRPGQWVMDCVYRPRETRLLRDAAAGGARIQYGLAMLLQQAADAFRFWTGIDPGKAYEQAAANMTESRGKNGDMTESRLVDSDRVPGFSPIGIVLIGMRGAGKSTVGKLLAERLGLPFVDTDGVVARDAGMTIRAIFESEGEAGFRRREREAIAAIEGPAVVAAGGGAVEDPVNVERLRTLGTVVWLDPSIEILAARVRNDPVTDETRPPLTGGDPVDELRTIADRRRLLYERASDRRGIAEGGIREVVDETVRAVRPDLA